MILWIAVALAQPAPVGGAHTRRPHTSGWTIDAGCSLLRVDIPSIPVLPIFTGGTALEVGLGERMDLGLAYSTHLGTTHELGVPVRLDLVRGSSWAGGLAIRPGARLSGAARESLAYGGDVHTVFALRGGAFVDEHTLSFSAGPRVQWLLFERIDRQPYADLTPWLAAWDVSVQWAWPDAWSEALSLRLELSVPRAANDPFAVVGVRPRLVFGGHFPG